MRDLPIVEIYKATDIIRLLVFSSWDPLHLQTNRVLRAKLKNLNSKPVQIQFHATDFYVVWLSVNHLTSEPSKIGAKDSSENSMAASSLQVELLEHLKAPKACDTHTILIKGNKWTAPSSACIGVSETVWLIKEKTIAHFDGI